MIRRPESKHTKCCLAGILKTKKNRASSFLDGPAGGSSGRSITAWSHADASVIVIVRDKIREGAVAPADEAPSIVLHDIVCSPRSERSGLEGERRSSADQC